MTAVPRLVRGDAVVGSLPTLLALVAEGAWVAVVASLLASAVGDPLVLRVGPMALAAFGGLAASIVLSPRVGNAWPTVAVALVAVAGAVGWAVSAAVAGQGGLASVPERGIEALAAQPGGWLAGLAFLRGMAHAQRADRPGHPAAAHSLLIVGVVAIVGAFVLGGALADAAGEAFRTAALEDTMVFVAAGLVAGALARIAELSATGGFDWGRNLYWLALLAALVAAILVVSVLSSSVIGPVVVFVVALLPVPMLIAGLLTGVDRRGLQILGIVAAAALLVVVVLQILPQGQAGLEPAPAAAPTQPPPDDQAWMTVAAWSTFLVVLGIVVAVLAALWMRQSLHQVDGDVAEERTIDRGEGPAGPLWRRPRWLRGRQPVPTDAVSAYLAAVAELARTAYFARRADETPAEHARRVRHAPRPRPPEGAADRLPAVPLGQALDLLAADYELATFGGRRLSDAEDRRGIARWRRIRAAARRGGDLEPHS